MPGQIVRKTILANARHIVVKLGTNAICGPTGRLEVKSVRSLARQIAEVKKAGVSVTLVASGAIGAGLAELDLPARPKTIPMLQATAAVGQGQLMRTFHDAMGRSGVKVGQVLITAEDFEDRTRYLNIRNTLTALHEADVLPIINENDATAIYEIRFGDNDIIAAHVTNMLSADVLVLLTTVDGVFKGKELLDVIEQVDDEALSLATDQRSTHGSGGMATKLQAAGVVTRAGGTVVIANARQPKVLTRLLKGENFGTVFVPAKRRLSSRRRWIGMTAKPAGKIIVDAGAVRALCKGGKSLLPSGIVGVEGHFAPGATVSIQDEAGNEIARGLTNYSADHVEKIKGLRTSQVAKVLGDFGKPYDEVVHRNNMTIS
ncbi:MAG: glutamate 5-kinase [Phycisphaerae bacterium]|nr:glutamate 5-kinase [Phycisphaerae bacterium]